jgi:anti-sigma factor ChrR (cupin superfamily)
MNDLEAGQLLCVRCDDLPWKRSTFAAGVFVKDVAVTDGLELQIVRFEPGARLPLHRHERPEFIYVLEGELILGGQHLSRGWANVASVGSVHSDVHSETGCIFVLIDRPI